MAGAYVALGFRDDFSFDHLAARRARWMNVLRGCLSHLLADLARLPPEVRAADERTRDEHDE